MTLSRRRLLRVGLATVAAGPASAQGRTDADDRRSMVEAVQHMFGAAPAAALPGRASRAVAGAMLAVPRHEFVPASLRRQAYENRPLPIGANAASAQDEVVYG